MQIAIASPEEMGLKEGRFPGWVPFPTDFLWPREIRSRIVALLKEEEVDESGETEFKLVTMNRTVLDLVTHQDIKNPGPMDYEDVYVWSDEKKDLVPLLELHDEDWLVHFALGDLLDRLLLP
jgi:hypothetical protein